MIFFCVVSVVVMISVAVAGVVVLVHAGGHCGVVHERTRAWWMFECVRAYAR